ncbi:hypothetical protein C3440_16130 [Escherichia coli]|nr:hypothetical protein C3440_16130 [Escherichia coli]
MIDTNISNPYTPFIECSARLIIPAVGVFLPVSSLWMGFHMLTENESWTVLLVLILIDWIKS